MSLSVIATPIGHPEDITLRAIRLLREADLIIGEERREVAQLLKGLHLQKPIELLNEHSKPQDLEFLRKECAQKKVALVSDCGTPGFCDPGSDLVSLCRRDNIEVQVAPGASSLMTLIAGLGQRLDRFVFAGFLPAKTELRALALKTVQNEKRAVVIMETPYRLTKLLNELALLMPERHASLGLDLTRPNEEVLVGALHTLAEKTKGQKREFLLMLHAL